MPGSQRWDCSSLQYSTKYGVVMSLCSVSPSPAPPMPAAASSSAITWLKRKSRRAAAAELLGDRHPDEAVLAGTGVQVVRGDAGFLPLEVVRGDLVGDERGERRAERLVLVVEDRTGRSVVSRLGSRRDDTPGTIGCSQSTPRLRIVRAALLAS